MKLSETNNKPAVIEEVTNYIITTLKAFSIVVIKGKRKCYSLKSTSPPIVDLISINSLPIIYKKKCSALGIFAIGSIIKKLV